MSGQRAETIALHGGQTADPDDEGAGRPDLPDDVVRVRRHPARRRPVRAQGAGQHLHAHHEPDLGRVRAARRPRSRAASPPARPPPARPPSTYSVLNLTRAGDNIISVSTLYGGTYNLFAHTLPQYGIEVRFADPDDPDAVARADRRQDAPRVRRDDRQPEAQHRRHQGLGRRRARAGPAADRRQHRADAASTAASSTTAPTSPCTRRRSTSAATAPRSAASSSTPAASTGRRTPTAIPGLTKPDPSYHGVVWSDALGPAAYIGRVRTVLLRNTGAALSPFNAFLFLQGLETLPLRMERHSANALAVARAPRGPLGGRRGSTTPASRARPYHDVAKRILSGGFGGLVTFGIDGRARGRPAASSRASSSSATSRTSATPSRWRSTTPRRRTRSSTRRSSRPPA